MDVRHARTRQEGDEQGGGVPEQWPGEQNRPDGVVLEVDKDDIEEIDQRGHEHKHQQRKVRPKVVAIVTMKTHTYLVIGHVPSVQLAITKIVFFFCNKNIEKN